MHKHISQCYPVRKIKLIISFLIGTVFYPEQPRRQAKTRNWTSRCEAFQEWEKSDPPKCCSYEKACCFSIIILFEVSFIFILYIIIYIWSNTNKSTPEPVNLASDQPRSCEAQTGSYGGYLQLTRPYGALFVAGRLALAWPLTCMFPLLIILCLVLIRQCFLISPVGVHSVHN